MAKLALIMPAYNEGQVIEDVIKGLHKTFRGSKYEYQIIVIDDGSRDDTTSKASSQGAHVIKHVLNIGNGGATATGLSYAHKKGFTIAATLDADGQHDPKDVLSGVNILASGATDLLIGSRLINSQGMSRVKVLGNKGLSAITYMLFGINVTDSQSGLRIFSSKALASLKWQTSGYEFCSEMLWRAKQSHLNIGEFPIQAIYTKYSKAKGQNNWNAVNIVKILLKRRILELFSE